MVVGASHSKNPDTHNYYLGVITNTMRLLRRLQSDLYGMQSGDCRWK
jgi:hypothetical protein